jgi:predicted aspartyl protease
MRTRKILAILLLIALVVWAVETLWIVQSNSSIPSQLKRQAESERKALMLQFANNERKLNNDYSQKKYLATGKTVYDRIFNAKEPTIVELIQRMAAESMPKGWNCQVRVEEFTHFILLVYLPHNLNRVEAGAIASYLIPVAKHCNQWLTDVSVFDLAHKSYLFFNKDAIEHIKREGKLTDTLLGNVKQQGESFTQFNSTTIQCEMHQGHLFLPIEIIGSSNVQTCVALLDTGASVTTVSRSIILQTGLGENELRFAPRRSFNTANGSMSCSVVQREVNIEGFRKRIEVAVNEIDEVNLLGMNYFRGMKYIVDSQNACIYIWEEQSIETPRINHIPRKSDLEDLRIAVGGERTETEPQDKESPGETVKPGSTVSSPDMNDLATFADKWLGIDRDANDAQKK